MTRGVIRLIAPAAALLVVGCRSAAPTGPPTASGYVDATEVKVASKVPGRIATVNVTEGQRVKAGDILVTIATVDLDLALRRATADRDQAGAQLRLLEAGTRPEDIRQAEAQLAASTAQQAAAQAELTAATDDEARFAQLLKARAGSAKQHDDAVARRDAAAAHVKAANEAAKAAAATLQKLENGPRPDEIAAARARVAASNAQVAMLQQNRADTTVVAPSAGVISSRLAEPGEVVSVGQPLIVLIDLDRAWANAYVEEPLVPRLKVDEAATVVTDAGDRLPGRIAFISPNAEFTPRNVQTADERAKLVYRVKVTVDNSRGILKPGMPVEVELGGGGR